MADRPKIPHEPWPPYASNTAKRLIRGLSEAGKLTSPGKRIPHYGRVNDADDKRIPHDGKIS